eukprot:1612411-Pyramimonas_sp.AAC.1
MAECNLTGIDDRVANLINLESVVVYITHLGPGRPVSLGRAVVSPIAPRRPRPPVGLVSATMSGPRYN